MTLKKYEKKFAVYLTTFFFFIMFMLFFIYLIFNKYFSYINFTGIISNEDVIFMVEDSELKYFHNNATLLESSKRKKYKIKKVYKNILTKENIKYHQVIINFKFSNKYKDNDSINISLKKKKERIISIFKILWEEE